MWLFKIRSCLWADGAQGLNVQLKGVLVMVAQPVCPGQGRQMCSPATTELILFKACVLLCFLFVHPKSWADRILRRNLYCLLRSMNRKRLGPVCDEEGW